MGRRLLLVVLCCAVWAAPAQAMTLRTVRHETRRYLIGELLRGQGLGFELLQCRAGHRRGWCHYVIHGVDQGDGCGRCWSYDDRIVIVVGRRDKLTVTSGLFGPV